MISIGVSPVVVVEAEFGRLNLSPLNPDVFIAPRSSDPAFIMPKALKVKAPANAVAAPRQKLVKTAAGPIIAQTGVQSQSSAKVKSKHAVVSKTQRKHGPSILC